jgi:hypothetical protein
MQFILGAVNLGLSIGVGLVWHYGGAVGQAIVVAVIAYCLFMLICLSSISAASAYKNF